MGKIILSEREFTFDELKKGNFSGSSDYEQQTLLFCHEWLNHATAFSISTSGSTGTPKTVQLSRMHMEISAKLTVEALKLSTDDYALVCINTEFIGGKMMLVRALETDMNIILRAPRANPFEDLSNDFHVQFTALVPYQIETILKEADVYLPLLNKMKAIIIGGAAISSTLEKEICNLSVPCYHTFGMTETISHIALRRLNGNDRSLYFKTLKNITVSSDPRNCLVISSPFSEDPIVTNDLVEIVDPTTFRWLGRVDFVINSGGIKVHPEKVEKELEQFIKEENVASRYIITGINEVPFGEKVCLIFEATPLPKEREASLIKRIREEISKYEQPKDIYYMDSFEETASGKIDRRKTREKLLASIRKTKT